jgi:hypothetical protein
MEDDADNGDIRVEDDKEEEDNDEEDIIVQDDIDVEDDNEEIRTEDPLQLKI